MKRIIVFASSMLLVGVSAFAATEDTSWGKVKEEVMNTQPAAKKSVSSQAVATAYECAQPATITASSYYWWSPDPSNGPAANAIDCDANGTFWNAGHNGPASVTVTFDSPRTLSGLYVTAHASALGDQNYTVTATRPDNTTHVVSAPFAIGAWWLGFSSMEFDFGQGFVEYKSVQIDITNATPWTWKAINEIELIVPVSPEAKGDCKNGGWEQFGFKNQGQCVRYVETGKDSR